jgi:hypothetical protein
MQSSNAETGSFGNGRSIMIHGEQGLREEILFASCYGDVLAQASDVTIVCDPRLAALFARSFPSVTVHESSRHTPCDVRSGLRDGELTAAGADGTRSVPATLDIMAGSLPRFVRRSRAEFPTRPSYLAADPQLVDVERRRLAEIPGLKVGLAWDGQPGWEQWRALLSALSVQFVMLEVDPQRDAIALSDKQFCKRVLLPEDCGSAVGVQSPTCDFDTLAARLSALDLLVATDGVTAHLAAALGVPVWLLLPFAVGFPWPHTGESTPWYSSVRLHRVRRYGAWPELFARVARELAALAEEHTSPDLSRHLRPDAAHAMSAMNQSLEHGVGRLPLAVSPRTG